MAEEENPAAIVSQTVTPADVRRSPEEIYSDLANDWYRKNQNTGLFRRMLINPDAAAMLPKAEQEGAVGKVGLFNIWGGAEAQFPFAAWAKQHQPLSPSMNTKLMEQAAKKFAEPKTDPRIQQNITNRFNDVVRTDYEQMAQKYGPGELARMIETNTAYGAEGYKDLNRLNDKLEFINNLSTLGTRLGKDYDKMQEDMQKGYTPFPESLQAMNEFDKLRYENVSPNEDAMEKFNKIDQKYQSTKNIVESLKQEVLPAGGILNKRFIMAKGQDAQGKPVTEIYSTENDAEGNPVVDPKTGQLKRGENLTEDLKQRATEFLDNHPEFKGTKYSNPDKLVEMMQYTLPHIQTQSFKEEPTRISVSTGAAKDIGQVYQGSQTLSFGSEKNKFHTDVDNFSIPETEVELGKIENVIGPNSAVGDTHEIGGNTKIGNIILAPMAVVGGQLVMIPNENKASTKNLFYAPMAIAQKPKLELRPVINPQTGKEEINPETHKPIMTKEPTSELETYYIPLNQVANVLKSKASGQEKGSEMENAIDITYKQAQEMNEGAARGTGKDDFQKYFGITRYDITQKKGETKKTKEGERIKSGATY